MSKKVKVEGEGEEVKGKVEKVHELLHKRMAELPTPPVNLRSEWRANIEMMRKFDENRDYFERRITALNRRACLHEGEHCGVRARQEITGMLCVLNALGYEAVGDWNRYDGEFELVPAEYLAAKKEGGAK